jgi:hypothetical protein
LKEKPRLLKVCRLPATRNTSLALFSCCGH